MAPRILSLIRKEFLDSIRSRWLISFTIITFFLVIGLPFVVAYALGLMAPGIQTLIAGTTQVVFPFLPLIALPIGSAAIVGERDKHTMELLLAQPISRVSVYVGKFVGIFSAISTAILVGMGVAALIIMETPTLEYFAVILLAFLLTAVFLSLAFLISVISKDRNMALGIALFFWFLFAVLIDMGFLSMIVTIAFDPVYMIPIVAANPLEVVRQIVTFGYIMTPEMLANPIALGQLGLAMARIFGSSGILVFLYTTILAWLLIPLVGSFILFIRKDV
jgi:ABC-type transport system involved in multi-copper enzyme maturation permease subunit